MLIITRMKLLYLTCAIVADEISPKKDPNCVWVIICYSMQNWISGIFDEYSVIMVLLWNVKIIVRLSIINVFQVGTKSGLFMY